MSEEKMYLVQVLVYGNGWEKDSHQLVKAVDEAEAQYLAL